MLLLHRQRTVWGTKEIIHTIGITPLKVRKELNKELQRITLMRLVVVNVFNNSIQIFKIQNSEEVRKESLFDPADVCDEPELQVEETSDAEIECGHSRKTRPPIRRLVVNPSKRSYEYAISNEGRC